MPMRVAEDADGRVSWTPSLAIWQEKYFHD
jgi:hypothetical protein